MRILIIGEAPSSRTSGGSKKRIGELAGRPVEDWADWVNLLDEWPGAGRGKGSSWNATAARRRAATLDLASYDAVVLLGRRVAGVVLPGGAGLPWFRWVEQDGERLVVIPHPSGIVRWWNDEANRERARQFLLPLAALETRKEPTMSTTTTDSPSAATAETFQSIYSTLLKRTKQAVRGADLVEKKGYTRVKSGGRTIALIHRPTKRSVRVEVPTRQEKPIGAFANFYVKQDDQTDEAFAMIQASVDAVKAAAKNGGGTDVKPDPKPSARKEPVAA